MNIHRRKKIMWPFTWLMWKWFGLTFKMKPWFYSDGIKRYITFPPVFFFIVGDILYNWTVGSFIFWERPRQALFTDRLIAHKAGVSVNSTPESKEVATEYCKLLGYYDPGHC